MKKKLKLYVWHDVLTDYTPGVMFALAHNIKEARKLLLEGCDYLLIEDLRKRPTIYTNPVAFDVWGGG